MGHNECCGDRSERENTEQTEITEQTEGFSSLSVCSVISVCSVFSLQSIEEVIRDPSGEIESPGHFSESPLFASPNPGKLGFKLLTLTRLEVKGTPFNLMDNAFAQYLPLEATEGLLKTLTGK